MSPEIVAVLVVPTEGDPGGLLAAGRCGAAPPEAYNVQDVRRSASARWELDRPLGTSLWAYALPLWWDGALVPEGWDRARRVYGRCGWDPRGYDPDCQMGIADPALGGALSIAEGLVACERASRVVRLARVDGRLVEVEP